MTYNPQKIERKWQKVWEKERIYKTEQKSKKKKFYALVEFPYPSGEGLHVGHVKGQTAVDVFSRYKRMQGYNVLNPMGYDAFGLPAENFAIKNKKHPATFTQKNIRAFIKQQKSFGPSFDWDRIVDTTDPKYYKWTQWIFLQLFKAGLAYEKEAPINWCPKDKTGLANEEVINGRCERCDTPVEKKNMRQWFLKITAYAGKLIKGLDEVNWPEYIKASQKNWIGKSEGATIRFSIVSRISADLNADSRRKRFSVNQRRDQRKSAYVEVFTTRLDTIFGCTYLVVAPEHPLVASLLNADQRGFDADLRGILKNKNEVQKYVKQAKAKTDLARTDLAKDKTGIELKGIKAVNPFNNEEVSIFVADYVLGSYGTGAVMAVPAHDERDWEFAKKYNLPVIQAIRKKEFTPRSYLMGAEKISDNELERIGVVILEKTKEGHRKVEIPKESLELYKNLIKEKITNGFWNEIVGDEILFIFKSKKGKIKEINLSKDTSSEIEKLGAEYNDEPYLGETNTWKWLAENNFYTDLIIHTEDGILINSKRYSGLTSQKAREEMVKWLEKNKLGGKKINYKLRDWLFSRQRYWGEPIPIIKCSKCGNIPLKEKDLPLLLPNVKNYKPTGTGESPLAVVSKWVNVKCPICGGPAKRETNTMPQWAGSSWYFLRYPDPKNKKEFCSKDALKHFMPVDIYFGGAEHTTVHLLYSRFWVKALYDLGHVPIKEPFLRRVQHGLVLGSDNRKMSKRWGNIINPTDVIKTFGADVMRVFIMFMGPYSDYAAWSPSGIMGIKRFIERVAALKEKVFQKLKADKKTLSLLHQTIFKVTKDIEDVSYHTAISKLMIMANHLGTLDKIPVDVWEIYLKLLAPFAPHLSEELWGNGLKNKKSIHISSWPKYDERLTKDEEFELVIQINGKVRDKISVGKGISQKEAEKIVLNSEKVKKLIGSVKIKKIIFVPGRLINIVL